VPAADLFEARELNREKWEAWVEKAVWKADGTSDEV
jgi:hypothetical protein